jgi:uncharacterized membrane protein YgcG
MSSRRVAMRRWVGPTAAIGAGIVLVGWAVTAHAEDPVDIETQITDQVDALGNRHGEVEAALAQLDADHQLQLFVVYVDSFAGLNAEDWANETANRNRFGFNDALLAIATGDREFGDSLDPDYPLTDEQLTEVATVAIEPPLRENDWAGAAIGAAEGYAAALDGDPIPEPEITPGEADPSADGIPWWLPIVAVAGIGAVGVYAYTRSRRRRQATSTASSQRSAPE